MASGIRRVVTARPRVAAAVTAALLSLVLLGVGAVTLSKSRTHVVASHTEVAASRNVVQIEAGKTRCQRAEFVPSDASVARVFVSSGSAGAAGAFILRASGPGGSFAARSMGGGPGEIAVALPARRPSLDPARVCFGNVGTETLAFAGNLTPANPAAVRGAPGLDRRPGDEVRVDFLGPPESWLDIAPEVAERWAMYRPFGLGPNALWVLLGAAFGLGLAALAIVFLPMRPARTCLVVAAIATGMGGVWSLVTPAFQGPDESAHAAYATHLGQTGSLPGTDAVERDRPELSTRMSLLYAALPFSVEGSPLWSAWQERRWEALDREIEDRPGSGLNYASGNPPLYYLLAGAVSRVTTKAGPLNELAWMRLVSALLGGITAGLTFLFLRELLPRHPFAWGLGGLALALQPMFSFLSGAVTVDAGLFTAAAALLLVMARILRRGLTSRRACALALIALAGVLTKSTLFALLPAAALTMLVGAHRLTRKGRRAAAVRATLTGVGLFAVGFAAWLLVNSQIFSRKGTTTAGFASTPAGVPGPNLFELFSYAWQFYLPRLPFMTDQWVGYPEYPVWEVYFKGFIGRFGWFQFNFPNEVNIAALIVLVGVSFLAVPAVVRAARRRRERLAELLVWTTATAGILALVAYAGYTYRLRTGLNFEQARYLFVILPLYALLFAAAIRSVSKPWQLMVAGLLVVLAVGHEMSALLLSLGRYYG